MSYPPSNLHDHLAIIVLHMTSTLTLLQLAYFFLLPEGKESDDECSNQKCSIADVTFFFKALHALELIRIDAPAFSFSSVVFVQVTREGHTLVSCHSRPASNEEYHGAQVTLAIGKL